jgi:hypothetical protein
MQCAKSAANLGNAKSAHNLAKCKGPQPLAVVAMLGLTRSLGQANPDHGIYDFSLSILSSPIFSDA